MNLESRNVVGVGEDGGTLPSLSPWGVPLPPPSHEKGEGNLRKEEARLGQPISQDARFLSGQNPAPWVPPAPRKGLSLGMEEVRVAARAWSSAFPFSDGFSA